MEKQNQQTRTELHTHLMGMLSAEKFLDFMSEHLDNIYWPLDDPTSDICFEMSQILSNDNLKKQALEKLKITSGTSVDYMQLNDYYKTRRTILKKIEEVKPDCKKEIYNKYVNLCLRELVNQGVEYVEISYSIRQVLLSFEMDKDLKSKIQCKFLLSTDRSNSLKNFKQSAKDLKKLLKNGVAVGFDIMGQERELSQAELDKSDNSPTSRSFKQKLLTIISQFQNTNNTTLRLHSGENECSNKNTEIILKMLEQIEQEEKITIPPPEIRIGHGIYFDKNDDYLRLLKKFKCIVEINASSNLALSNISSYKQIPYGYYLENNIPIVISTDGHGLYDTNIKKENEIAQKQTRIDQYKNMLAIDERILDTKTNRK